MGSPTLSNRQRIFVLEYLTDGNGTRAAIAAGYSPKTAAKTACRLLKNPTVAAIIAKNEQRVTQRMEEARERVIQRYEITAEKVLQDIAETVERCKQAAPVVDKKGEPVMVPTPSGEVAPAFKFDPANVLKGCELLGKHLKLFVERVEVGNLEDSVSRMTDEEFNEAYRKEAETV